MVSLVQHILAESLKQSNEVQKFVTSSIGLLGDMATLLDKYSNPAQTLNAEQIYEMAVALRNISTNYGAVALLKVAQDHVAGY